MYYDAKAVAAASLRAAVAEALESVSGGATSGQVVPTFIPVSGASCTFESRQLNLLVLDITAAGAYSQP